MQPCIADDRSTGWVISKIKPTSTMPCMAAGLQRYALNWVS
jgi:hypothetical protein